MKEIQGNRLLFELARGWSWRGFELSGVNCNIFDQREHRKNIDKQAPTPKQTYNGFNTNFIVNFQ